MRTLKALSAAAVIGGIAGTSQAALVITEAMSSSGSGGTPDWFEVTNNGPSAVNFADHFMDDSSFSFATAQALEGVTSIGAFESVVFVIRESDEDTATIAAAFKDFWGGIAGVQVGTYLDAGTGFSSNGDGVVVFNGSAAEVTPRASFGSAVASTGFSFEYSGVDGSTLDLSVAGQNGAFVSANALGNVGSPGFAVVPEPASVALLGTGALLLARRRRRA